MANNTLSRRILLAVAGMLLCLAARDAMAAPWYVKDASMRGPRVVVRTPSTPSTPSTRPLWPLQLAVVHRAGCPDPSPTPWPPADPTHPFPLPETPWVYVWPLDWDPCGNCTSNSACTGGGPKPDVEAIPVYFRTVASTHSLAIRQVAGAAQFAHEPGVFPGRS